MELNKQLSIDYSEYWRPSDLDEARNMILTGSPPESFERAGKHDAELVSKYMPENPVVLDFGCGVGRVIKYLPPCGVVYGVDVSPDMLELAKVRLSDRDDVVLVNDDGSHFPRQFPSFDMIYSFWTFQHLDKQDALAVMTRLARALKRGGHVIYSFYSETSGDNPDSVRGWSAEEVTQTLRDKGILLVDAYKDLRGTCFIYIGQKFSLIRPWRFV